MVLLPSSPVEYLTVGELPLYASGVEIDLDTEAAQIKATALIRRAGQLIVSAYQRTGEIVTISQEIIEVNDNNMGHLAHSPIQVTSTGALDTAQGDLIEARYSATQYPYAGIFGAPQWQTVDPVTVDIHPQQGTVWMAPGLFPIPYTEARITYRAGYCAVGGPYPSWLKQACGLLIENIVNRSGTTIAKKTQMADQQQVEYWDSSFFTEEVKLLLSPLKIRMFF